METTDSTAPFSAARLISCLGRRLGGALSDVLHKVLLKVEEHSQKISLILNRSMPVIVHPQTTENTNDAKAPRNGNSTSFEDPENKKPRDTFEIVDQPRKVTGLQRARRIHETTGSRLRTLDATANNSLGKVRKKINVFLWIVLASMIAGADGRNEQIKNVTINESVTLSVDAKDFDAWLLSPASHPEKYFTIYPPGQDFREHGCEGYRFGKDHSIYIDKVQRCHAGTYTAEYLNNIPLTIVLNVNDDAEVTFPMETTKAFVSEAIILSSLPDKESQDTETTVKVVVIIAVCVTTIVAIVIITLCLKGKCKKSWNKSPTNGIKDNAATVAFIPASTDVASIA